jgi:phosphatidate cytidylyltransferase
MSAEMTQPKPRSDLGVRTLSGVIMMAVTIGAIVMGGGFFVLLVAAVGFGVLWEWVKLVKGFTANIISRTFWYLAGLSYVGVACFTLIIFSTPFFGMLPTIVLIAGVIGTDVGAYFAGRTLGGPKIAPKISPSKTWSGLFGGAVGAGIMMNVAGYLIYLARNENPSFSEYSPSGMLIPATFGAGMILALIAQAGDFFESWMKRKANVKDSGNLIPGHGGMFDRTDGFIAVFFVTAVAIAAYMVVSRGMYALIDAIKFVLFVAN